MSSPTIQFGELISTDNRDNKRPPYTPRLLQKIATLLDNGADINIAICIYQTTSGSVYRLVGSNPEIDHIIRGQVHGMSDMNDASKWLHLVNLTAIATPLIDAADQENRGAISLFASRGARIEPILETLSSKLISQHKLWDPFLLPGTEYRYKCIQQMLDLASPKHKLVQSWMQQAFNTAAPSIRLERLALMLLLHGTQPLNRDFDHRSSGTLIGFAHHYQILPAALSTSSPGFIRVVFLGNIDICALVPRDQTGQIARGPCGITPLIVAVGNASAEICNFLLDLGMSPNEFDDFGMTALMDAIYYGHEEALDLLLARGAETETVNLGPVQSSPPASIYVTPMSDDQWNERVEYATMCQQKGWHALHLAAHHGRLHALRALCDASTQIAALDCNGHSPLDIAMRNSQDQAAYYLLGRRCSFDTRSSAASRMLTQAIINCKHDIVSQLIESGVLPSLGSGFGGEPVEVENLSEMRERSVKLLPQRVSETGPLEKHAKLAADLCLDCSLGFKSARFSPASSPGSDCKFCQLLADCGHERPGYRPKLWYSMKDDAKDDEVVVGFPNPTIRHPIKKVQNDWHSTLERIKLCDDGDTSSPAAMAMASTWLRRCIDGHRQCSYSRTFQYSPTRVLDLDGVNDGHPPKLLQNATLCEPYLALSHRWGSQGLPVTTKNNLAGRLERIDMTELSQVMRDAVQIVMDLGYRYLWIDALCIIQDSTDDWLSEASKMSSVFSGAVVTIAVADAENQSEGIFRKRSAQCMRPFYVPWLKAIPHRDRMHIDNEAKYYIFPRSKLVGGGTRTKGTLDTRGWVLQEQLLSTRILYYDKGEIYWDCITLSASESSPISASLLEVTNPDEIWAQKLIRRTIAGAIDGNTLRTRISDAWLEIIKNYSSRILTHHSDRLIALKGIIEPLKVILGEDHVVGMWRENLWLQLTWWTPTPNPGNENTTTGFSAPSWSWLNIQERVYYHNSLLGEHPEKDVVTHKFTDLRPFYFEIDDIASEQLPGNIGIVGTLTVTAKSFPYRLIDKDLKKILYKRWNKSALKLNTGRWILDAPVELPLDLHCVIVAEDTVAKMLVCLCIVPDKEQDGRWKRVGLCHWDGLPWQISSFIGMEPEKRTFTLV